MIRWASVLLLAALLSPAAIAAQHVPGIERIVTAPRPAISTTNAVMAASNGRDFLVLSRSRGAFYTTRFTPGAASGLTTRLRVSEAPWIANAGDGYVVAWNEGAMLFAGAIGDSGALHSRFFLGTRSTDETIHAFVGNESNALLVLRDWSTGRVRARLLDPNGAPAGEWLDAGATAFPLELTASADPNGFLLAVVEDAGVRVRRITPAGVSQQLIPLTRGLGYSITLLFDGSDHLLMLRASSTRAIVLGTDGTPKSDVFEVVGEGTAVWWVAPRTGGALLFANSGNESFALVFDSAARTVQKVNAKVSPSMFWGVAGNGRYALAMLQDPNRIVWFDAQSGAQLTEPLPTFLATPDQSHPAIALGENVDLIVWQENDRTIAAARVLRDGTVLDRTPMRVSAEGVTSVQPAVTFDGAQFVVVWCEVDSNAHTGRLVARRIREDGSTPDFAPIVISDAWSETPAIAHSGDTTLVAWAGTGTRQSTHGPAREIFGARLTRAGVVLDSVPLLLARDAWDHYEPELAAGDDLFIAGWQTYQWYGHHSPVNTAASVAFVTPGGTVSEPIALHPLEANANVSAPRVASNGSEFFAAYTWRDGSVAATVSPSGVTATAPLPLTFVAAAAFFEGSWLVMDDDGHDLRGAYLSRALRFEQHLPLIASEDDETQPALASDGARAMLSYQRAIRDLPYAASGTIVFRLFDDARAPRMRTRAAAH